MSENSFSEIFEKWEKSKKSVKKRKNIMEKALEYYSPDNSVIESKKDNDDNKKVYSKKLEIRPQATLDLHGLTSLEAERQLAHFIREACEKRYKQVLIIHGKGNHSQKEPVLKGVVYQYLRENPFVGRLIQAPRHLGGSGAVCAFIRYFSL